MATVKVLKAYLETIPEEAEVFVLRTVTHGWDTYSEFTNLNLHPYEGNSDFSDYHGSKRLYLGEN